jgi:hypothetical protein
MSITKSSFAGTVSGISWVSCFGGVGDELDITQEGLKVTTGRRIKDEEGQTLGRSGGEALLLMGLWTSPRYLFPRARSVSDTTSPTCSCGLRTHRGAGPVEKVLRLKDP